MPDRRDEHRGRTILDLIKYQQWKGCFIATAAYGTDTAREIDTLREFRDKALLTNSLGARFVSFYYRASPPMADFIARHDSLRVVVRRGFIHPIVGALNKSRRLWS